MCKLNLRLKFSQLPVFFHGDFHCVESTSATLALSSPLNAKRLDPDINCPHFIAFAFWASHFFFPFLNGARFQHESTCLPSLPTVPFSALSGAFLFVFDYPRPVCLFSAIKLTESLTFFLFERLSAVFAFSPAFRNWIFLNRNRILQCFPFAVGHTGLFCHHCISC